ncbi:MAG TPA: imidazole glycerol phosphate synthase subunit HisH [bacterium]|nr:imidazole glycerol phosphate synthase subunit HisH [bacterium]
MIAIIDYGMGNLGSVFKALEGVGCDVRIVDTVKDISDADGIVLPGVGAMSAAMNNLERHGLIETVIGQIKSGKPFLGICLGLQMLFEYSEEGGRVDGLGVLKGKVARFTDELKVPHMGWNQLNFKKRPDVVEGIPEGSFFYFVHSFYVVPDDDDVVMTTTDYGIDFVSSISVDNITAVQFHPEKSQKWGLKLLENFGRSVGK